MKTVITCDDILALKPCYDPIKYIPKDWKGTVLDILEMPDVKPEDKFWVVLREEFISEKILRLFAVACCREIQHLITDPRSLKALDVAEAYANGNATKEELRTAATTATTASNDAYAARTAYASTTTALAAKAAAATTATTASYASNAAYTAAAATTAAKAAAANVATTTASETYSRIKQIQILIKLLQTDRPMSNNIGTTTTYAAKAGVKHDQEKPDMSLLSPIAMTKVAQVMTYGKKKYSANNWRGGIVWTRLLAAALRHIFSFSGGETKDPETGLSHLAHASCCLMMLLEFEDTKPDLDDRWKEPKK